MLLSIKYIFLTFAWVLKKELKQLLMIQNKEKFKVHSEFSYHKTNSNYPNQSNLILSYTDNTVLPILSWASCTSYVTTMVSCVILLLSWAKLSMTTHLLQITSLSKAKPMEFVNATVIMFPLRSLYDHYHLLLLKCSLL